MEPALIDLFTSATPATLAILVIYLLGKEWIKHARESSKELAKAVDGSSTKITDKLEKGEDLARDTNNKVTTLVDRNEPR